VGEHICGPRTCNYGGNAPQCDGTQWIDHDNLWDESLLADDFFAAQGAPQLVSATFIQQGSSGPLVSALQANLNRLGAQLAVDGQFGPATKAAVEAFQVGHGCTVDGVVGPQTDAAIQAALNAPPAPAPAPTPPPPAGNPFIPLPVDGVFGPQTIQALQWVLHAATDGVFGPISKQALQAHLGVVPDGIIGPQTVRSLQARIGAAQDGLWGADTTRHLQAALNANGF
jgi:peptidoglycan hydrolase-like protein with peptidoglycan-binding domain